MNDAQHGESPIRVLLADDQDLVLDGIATILQAQPGLEVVARASTGQAAIDLAAELSPDIVCMDIEMPGMSGIEATRQIVSGGGTQVIMLTTFNREDYLLASLHAGASGFLLKTSSPEQLIAGIRSVASGDALLAPEVTRSLIEHAVARSTETGTGTGTGTGTDSSAQTRAAEPSTPASALTPAPSPPTPGAGPQELTTRERDVLSLAAQGLSNSEIGAQLFIGAETVKTHISNVLAKLNLRNRVQAVAFAYQHRIVDVSPE